MNIECTLYSNYLNTLVSDYTIISDEEMGIDTPHKSIILKCVGVIGKVMLGRMNLKRDWDAVLLKLMAMRMNLM